MSDSAENAMQRYFYMTLLIKPLLLIPAVFSFVGQIFYYFHWIGSAAYRYGLTASHGNWCEISLSGFQ